MSFNNIKKQHDKKKGNIDKKRKIWCAIGRYIEPILKSNELENNGYKQLEKDAGYLLNNMDIRHNNKDVIIEMSPKEQEVWYDKTYHTLLMVITMDNQIDISNDIKALKKWENKTNKKVPKGTFLFVTNYFIYLFIYLFIYFEFLVSI